MKAIVVRQPWATLIALGLKVIETRPAPPNGPMRPAGVRGLPGLAVERGERIAIVAGAAVPKVGPVGDGPLFIKHLESRPHLPLMVGGYKEGPWLVQVGGRFLGAVVCTVRVDDALPIVGEDGDLDNTDPPCIEHRPTGAVNAGLWLWPAPGELGDDMNPPDITDQLPLGDFTPGRWGWMLSDPQPCDLIPCKGKQGVFALPDDVAEALR